MIIPSEHGNKGLNALRVVAMAFCCRYSGPVVQAQKSDSSLCTVVAYLMCLQGRDKMAHLSSDYSCLWFIPNPMIF